MIKIFFTSDEESPDMTFVEIENKYGKSIRIGKWDKEDIYNVLTITKEDMEKLES